MPVQHLVRPSSACACPKSRPVSKQSAFSSTPHAHSVAQPLPTPADRAASGRALERRKALGEHESHEQGLKRDTSRRLQRSGSSGKAAQGASTAGQLAAAAFVLASVLSSAYIVVLLCARGAGITPA